MSIATESQIRSELRLNGFYHVFAYGEGHIQHEWDIPFSLYHTRLFLFVPSHSPLSTFQLQWLSMGTRDQNTIAHKLLASTKSQSLRFLQLPLKFQIPPPIFLCRNNSTTNVFQSIPNWSNSPTAKRQCCKMKGIEARCAMKKIWSTGVRVRKIISFLF